MKRYRPYTLLFAAALCAALLEAGQEMGSGSAELDNGVVLNYKLVVEPPLTKSAFTPVGWGFHNDRDSIQQFVYDRSARSYIGYAMTLAPGATPQTRLVSFGPFDESKMRDTLKAVAGDLPLNAAPLPKYPAPQTVNDGDTIALDLMVSPDGKEKMVSYIHFSFDKSVASGGAASAAAASAEPRDFTVDDGPVRLSTEPAEVRIDGQKFSGAVVMYSAQGGATPWFYFPGQGRYILSLVPHDGLLLAGAARGGVISFNADGHQYEIRLAKPLAGADKAWNLYVGRDPQYVPRPALVQSVVGSADRLDNLLPKQ